jgi:hypothetical protein
MQVNSNLHAPAALPTGKESPILIGYEAGWMLWRREKSFALAGNRTSRQTRRYTDWATPDPEDMEAKEK